MAAASMRVDDTKVLRTLRRLMRLGHDLTPVMQDIAQYGESSTRLRFRTQTAPDGTQWKRSLRAQISGGKTLTASGHLGDSITNAFGRTFAEWGTNRIYAAIHQFGGVIRPRKAKALRFRLASGAWVSTKQVTMPKRAFLGISGDDRTAILDIIVRRIHGAENAG